RQADRDLEDELNYHLERQIQALLAKGMTAEQARRAALRELGGLEQIKEECRDRRRGNLVQNLMQDLRYGFRIWRKNPGFTAAAVLTLALGVGANVAVFAVIEAALLRPFPYADAGKLVIIKHRDQRTGITKEFIAIGDYVDLAARQSAFEEFSA